MSKVSKVQILVAVIGIFISVSVFAMPRVSAFEVRKDKNLEKTEVVTGDLFITGENVDVAGTVNGNLFVGGASVQVSGKVTGNVFAGGTTVLVTGDVGKSIFVGGSTVDISGNVGRDVFLGSSQATVSGPVAESAFMFGGTVVVKSDIKENLYAGAGQITVLGTVEKDAFVGASTASIQKELVKGQLNLRLEDKTKRVSEWKMQRADAKKAMLGLTTFAVFMKITTFIGMFLLGLIVWKLFPSFSTKVEAGIMNSFAKNFGIGLLVYLASPLAVIMLLVTVIGIPIAGAFMGLLSAVMFLTSVWAGKALGQYTLDLLKIETSGGAKLFVGQLLLALVRMIPFLGFFVTIVVNSVVLGAVINAQRQEVMLKK